MGDSNLHLNIPVRRYDKSVERELEPFVYEWIQQRRGSISAEHGLGLAKRGFVGYSRSATMLRLMGDIKRLYDPVSFLLLLSYLILERVLGVWGSWLILMIGITEGDYESVQVYMMTLGF